MSNLFTPASSPAPVGPSAKVTLPLRQLFITLPSLSSDQKKLYKGGFLASEVDFADKDLDKVIGEHREGKKLYYYARFKDGISHKFLAAAFRAKYEDLVKNYERDKDEGRLEPFDPAAYYVHPQSRVIKKMMVNSGKTSVRMTSTPASSGQPSEDNNENEMDDTDPQTEADDSDLENYSEGDDDDDGSVIVRRSGRIALEKKRTVRDLPFSPKKTRSRHIPAIQDSDDQSSPSVSEAEAVGPTRRSTRTRKSTKTHLADDDDFDDNESDSDDVYGSSHKTAKAVALKKKRNLVRGRASRAAYGRFRAVADLDYDQFSDEETAPLRRHRDVCEKCHRKPAHQLLKAERKKPTKQPKKKVEFEESGNEEEKLTALGGWVRCLKCPVSAHWRCLASTQRDEILKAALQVDRALLQAHPQNEREVDVDMERPKTKEPVKRAGLDAYQTTEFICGACMKGGICMVCMEVALEADISLQPKPTASARDSGAPGMDGKDADVEMTDSTQAANTSPSIIEPADKDTASRELLFRCFTCKRLGHYRCLPVSVDAISAADRYQNVTRWRCGDCLSYTYGLDQILAWRPYPPNAIEPPRPTDTPPSHKTPLPREYLVKWTDRSYRRTQWVPHMWLVATHGTKLKNFLATGPRVELLLEAFSDNSAMDIDGGAVPTFEIGTDEQDVTGEAQTKAPALPSDPSLDAELKIPPIWKTVDRVLDMLLWTTHKRVPKNMAKSRGNAKRRGKQRDHEDPETDENEDAVDEDDEIKEERATAFNEGEQPSADLTETIEEWEKRTKTKLQVEQIEHVVWAFFKWGGLGYDEACWDSPPRPGEFGYSAFEAAFKRFVDSRDVTVPILSRKDQDLLKNRVKTDYARYHLLKDGEQPILGQNDHLKLMPFQVDGFNWLSNNWWTGQHCILADEMGLGKTVQIATFLGNIIKKFNAYPALVVVPNSTITNWVREFMRWAPGLRVVPFFGEAKARDVIKNFELSHDKKAKGTTGAKFHVLVTTYESLINPRDFHSVFRSQPRWEVLVVDEGQRLKSDRSLLFKKLNELNTIHRIIMTGTPLNNNIRELFNLMNFLDPAEWHDLEGLEKEHEELTEELVKQLHNRLKPYFLRRIKSEVLELPPKNEVIVPVSMAPLQKEIYRLILSHNLHVLKGITQPSNAKEANTANKTSINNMLMQLRKCLQHPYLYSEEIEPRGLPPQETHEKLIDASAKLRLLKILLPKLKARGHRVLLFSQFVIALNVIEDFLVGEGFNFLRLDGNTKQADRQKGMDEFNHPGSEVFIYLLTTRAGGVGINLWSADTVIIFDPDFNPHQDLQAIARAHRYGQTKTCLVFKLMVKDSAEERIVQTGKKKLVLDHLIVQKMDDDDSLEDNVQSILTYGAQALFEEEQGARDIIYTDNDIEKLIEKTETEGDQVETTKETGMSFAFAKIWAADKDSLEDVAEDLPDDQGDSWAQTLQRIASEREKIQAKEVTGRGVRRRAAGPIPQQNLDLDDTPKAKSRPKSKKSTSKSRSVASDDSAYTGSVAGSDGEESGASVNLTRVELTDLTEKRSKRTHHREILPNTPTPPPYDISSSIPAAKDRPPHPYNPPLSPIHNPSNHTDSSRGFCGLCETIHGDGDCAMTESSENLAEFRQMLISNTGYESVESRFAAIKAIDDELHKRGNIHLIIGQPLHLVQQPANGFPKHEAKRADHGAKRVSLPIPSTGGASKPADKRAIPEKNAVKERMKLDSPAEASASSNKAQKPAEMRGPALVEHSKRTSPFPDNSSLNKRPKPSVGPSCVVCGRTPLHLLKDCPVIAEEPTRILREIERLKQDRSPASLNAVNILLKILAKQKKEVHELQSSASGTLRWNGDR